MNFIKLCKLFFLLGCCLRVGVCSFVGSSSWDFKQLLKFIYLHAALLKSSKTYILYFFTFSILRYF